MNRPSHKEARPDSGAGTPPDQRASWFPAHEFLQAVLDQANVGPLPAAGTPSWLELPAADPRKLLALAEAGVRHVLRIECEQFERDRALAQANQAIAGAADWSAVARRVQFGPGDSYIPRKAS